MDSIQGALGERDFVHCCMDLPIGNLIDLLFQVAFILYHKFSFSQGRNGTSMVLMLFIDVSILNDPSISYL
jgi:hypothetical protein